MQDVLKVLKIHANNPGAFIDGTWASTQTTTKIIVENPTTAAAIASVYEATQADLENMIRSAEHAFLLWRNVPAPKRGDLVYALGQKLRENKDALGSLVAMETGKSKVEGDGEVQEMIDMADFAVGQSRMLYGLSMHSERPAHRMYEQWHPLGVVGVITAFNFPVAVWAWNAFLALVCGNVVVWKPSTKAPLSSIAVMHLVQAVCHALALPKGIISLAVTENKTVIANLVNHPKIPLISFTGSTATGRIVAEQVARRLGRYLLELGGNNAAIVMADADLKQVVPAVVFGAIGTAGQRCTSLRRLFVQREVFQPLLVALKHAYAQIKVGDPCCVEHHMGPLIDAQAVQHYQQVVRLIRDQGGVIHFGGAVMQGAGYFVQPTLAEVSATSALLQAEHFVPILMVIPFDNYPEAIQRHNEVPQGLSSAIFTQSIQNAEQFLSVNGSDCGIACINQSTSGAEIGGAFGGEKDTGGGREAGSDAWKAYMRRQTVTINYGDTLPLAQGIEFTDTV